MKHSTAIAQLRHLYQQMLDGNVKDMAGAARGLLGPAIAALEEAGANLEDDLIYINKHGDCGDNSCHVTIPVTWYEDNCEAVFGKKPKAEEQKK